MSNNQTRSGGLGCLSVLGIIFVVLKLLDLIDWTWIQVLAPFIIELGIVAILLLVVIVARLLSNR